MPGTKALAYMASVVLGDVGDVLVGDVVIVGDAVIVGDVIVVVVIDGDEEEKFLILAPGNGILSPHGQEDRLQPHLPQLCSHRRHGSRPVSMFLNVFSPLTKKQNKLECLAPENIFCQIKNLWVRPYRLVPVCVFPWKDFHL